MCNCIRSFSIELFLKSIDLWNGQIHGSPVIKPVNMKCYGLIIGHSIKYLCMWMIKNGFLQVCRVVSMNRHIVKFLIDNHAMLEQ